MHCHMPKINKKQKHQRDHNKRRQNKLLLGTSALLPPFININAQPATPNVKTHNIATQLSSPADDASFFTSASTKIPHNAKTNDFKNKIESPSSKHINNNVKVFVDSDVARPIHLLGYINPAQTPVKPSSAANVPTCNDSFYSSSRDFFMLKIA